jgi:hypothetical protein
MSRQHPFDSLEHTLVELHEAEQAGVFRSTKLRPQSAAAPKRESGWHHWRRWALVGLPAAACVVLAVGLVGLFPTGHNGDVQPVVTADSGHSAVPLDMQFFGCFNGPGADVRNECVSFDRDQDGDVDMVDFSALQLAPEK